ncbi:FAD-binding protein [candidate division CSSED10-310 bacterium]|uniref:FAD-binding protein n=1 Tax=candidate division CSSED10-310 bacterium TaxID=2855610 RepID=A0ABV6Z144_UNCC1
MANPIAISKKVITDVLIIGAGGAGLRAAAAIKEKSPFTSIAAITKVSSAQKSHTCTAQGGVAAVDPKDPHDKIIYHEFDTWKGSDCSCDQNVVRRVCSLAWDEIIWLEHHGLHFSRSPEGRIMKRPFGGHTLNFGEIKAFRSCYEADRTGKGIQDTVYFMALKNDVQFYTEAVFTELILDGECCYGAILYDMNEGEFVECRAKATIIATGGKARMYQVTSNCRQNTGDALSIFLRQGLPLMDIEAVQFHPTGIVGPGILASEALRGEGAVLRNNQDERFMERYAPTIKDLAPRDLVSRSIMTEIQEGRGFLHPAHQLPHVMLDMRHLPDVVHDKKLVEVSSFFKTFLGVDPKVELCPVTPTAHYQMGGIPTNIDGQVQIDENTIIAGLYAVGECATASLHGHNRLGTNSLLELITLGRTTGEHVADYISQVTINGSSYSGDFTRSTFDKLLAVSNGSESQFKLRRELTELMNRCVGVFRDEKILLEAIEKLKELKERANHVEIKTKNLVLNQELLVTWELHNLIDVSLGIAASALDRKESRGAHFRLDFPERSDDYHYHTLCWMDQDMNCRLGKRKIDMSIYETEQGALKEKFGIIERKY